MPSITCIIPAYNEEKTIKEVLTSVKESLIFDEIIVVNDGSSDSTAEILSKENNIIFINLEKNIGKGGAVHEGFRRATGEIILMLDADLLGLKKEHFEKILLPLKKKEADVCIGIITNKERPWMSIAQFIGSDLSGQQAFYKSLIEDANIKDSRFGLEIALKNHFKKKNARVKKVLFKNINHLMKEQKMGLKTGVKHRTNMYKEVGKEIGKNVKEKIAVNNKK